MRQSPLLLCTVLLFSCSLYGGDVAGPDALDEKLQGMFGVRFGEGCGANIDALVALDLGPHLSFDVFKDTYFPMANPESATKVVGLTVVDVHTFRNGDRALEFRLLFVENELAQVQWFNRSEHLVRHVTEILGEPTRLGYSCTWDGKIFMLQVDSGVSLGNASDSGETEAVSRHSPFTLTNVSIARSKVKPLIESADRERARFEAARQQKDVDLLRGKAQIR